MRKCAKSTTNTATRVFNSAAKEEEVVVVMIPSISSAAFSVVTATSDEHLANPEDTMSKSVSKSPSATFITAPQPSSPGRSNTSVKLAKALEAQMDKLIPVILVAVMVYAS